MVVSFDASKLKSGKMKKTYLTAFAFTALVAGVQAQSFPIEIDVTNWDTNTWEPTTVVMPQSPITSQVLFVGGTDMVQTINYNGQQTTAPAKQWHDFIGFTPDPNSSDLGWISVNHEMILADDEIGDGGGMTVFKVRRQDDSLVVVNQTLNDGRSGEFFNVDFIGTVGETGMNCGGITSNADGRIWTAEEWFRSSTSSIYRSGDGVRDTADWTVSSDVTGSFDGTSISKFQNFNYMVEIDPTQATAIRKQYNWGRFGFEGGVVMPDNRTAYLGVDATPAAWMKFIADTPGDFRSGTLYTYKHNATNKWIPVDNDSFNDVFDLTRGVFSQHGATMLNRVEWVAYSEANGKVYFTETGRDNPGSRWADELADGGVLAPHHVARATAQGTTADDAAYVDYYGRVMEFDPATDEMRVFLAGGPEFHGTAEVDLANYPNKHLTNPDGLNFYRVNVEGTLVEYMIICEDLNGTSHGRTPKGVQNRTCEMFLLDMTKTNPTVDDLIRLAVIPQGAEVTGAIGIDEKTILLNSQHPSTSNPFPYNNSLTLALHGVDEAVKQGLFFSTGVENIQNSEAGFLIYPNPATREIRFNKTTDVAIYNISGQRIRVARNVNYVLVNDLDAGTYFVRTIHGETSTLVIQ